MKRLILFMISVVFLVFYCSENTAFDTGIYGEALTLSEVTNVSTILANPEEFVGKKVLIEGAVLEVCQMKGCWIDVAGDMEGTRLKAQAEDDVIVFPQTSIGKTFLVEGEIYEINLTKEEAIEMAKHHAEEMGVEFDPSTVTGPETRYQIKVAGAVVK